MNRKKSILSISLFISLSFTMSAQTKNVMNNTDTKQQVLNAVLKMTNAFHNKDITGIMDSYEKNAVVVFEPESPVSETKQIKQMFEELFHLNPKFTYSGHEVFVSGNTATHFAPWTMTGTTPDGNEIKQSGLSVAVLRKQADGNWLMIFDNPHGQYLMEKGKNQGK